MMKFLVTRGEPREPLPPVKDWAIIHAETALRAVEVFLGYEDLKSGPPVVTVFVSPADCPKHPGTGTPIFAQAFQVKVALAEVPQR
jgi:hypothetical protein